MCKPVLQECHSKQQNRRLVEATVALLLRQCAPAVWAHPQRQVYMLLPLGTMDRTSLLTVFTPLSKNEESFRTLLHRRQ